MGPRRPAPVRGQQRERHRVGDGHVTRRVVSTIPMGTDPTSIAVLPNGQKGYVTNLNDGTVTVLDLAAS